MNKQIGTITKVNLKNIRIPYFVTGLIFFTMLVQTLIYAIVMASGKTASQGAPSNGMYLWLLVIMAAIFIPIKHYKKISNLGGKRNDFIWSSFMTYAVLAGAVSLVNTILYYTFERFFISTGNFVGIESFMQNPALIDDHYVFFNLVELFGWTTRGLFYVFIQQFAFLLMLAAAVHTLTAIQDKWYGWLTDLIIAAVLAVFIPIASLRVVLLGFFNLIIFHPNALLQILNCLVLSILIYSLNIFIFARKVI